MARTVNSVAAQVQILEIATLTSNRTVRAAHRAFLVTGNHMLGATHPDGGTSILNIELEAPHPALVFQIPGLGILGGIRRTVVPSYRVRATALHMSETERLLVIQLGEVTSDVHIGIALRSAHAVNCAIKDRTPVPVHLTVAQLNASQVPRIRVGGGGLALQVSEGTTNVQVAITHVQGLNLYRYGSNAANHADIPVLSNLTGLRIQNYKTVVVLAVHLVERTTHSKQAVRQSLNRLHLTVNLRAEGTAQLAGTHLVTSQESLLNLLAACRLNIREIATGKDSATDLGDRLNLGVHLAVLTGSGISAGTPLPLLGVAIG